MRMLTTLLTLVTLFTFTFSCSDGPPVEEGPPDVTAEESAWPAPQRGPAYAPAGTGSRMNSTDEEKAAWRDASTGGTLLLRLTDAGSGKPIPKCNFGAFKHSLDHELVDRKNSPRITRRGVEDRPDGVHSIPLGRGFYRLRLSSPTYRWTWTPIFEIRPGEDTRLAIEMLPANRLVATVLDERGEPLARGALSLKSEEGLNGTMVIENGRGETLVYVDQLTIEVGTVFLTEYAPQRLPVSLEPGVTARVEIRLERR